MELRLLELVISLLDPRKWRRRLLQLAAAIGAVIYVWVRAVNIAPRRRAVRDVKRSVRNRELRDASDRRTQRKLEP